MKYLIIAVLLSSSLLSGCSGGGSSNEPPVVTSPPVVVPTSIVMYCDSMGLSNPDGLTWLEMLGDLAQVDVDFYCKGGIQIREYPLEGMIVELGTNHKYAIIALGVNDYQLDMIETLNIYGDFLTRIDETGMEAVCFLYPESAAPSLKVISLNEGITALCQGRKIIISGPQIVDYIHFSDEGRMSTAENAWRALY